MIELKITGIVIVVGLTFGFLVSSHISTQDKLDEIKKEIQSLKFKEIDIPLEHSLTV